MCDRGEAGLKGMDEQMTNGQITLFLLLLYLLISLLFYCNCEGWADVVIRQVQQSSESRLFSQDTMGEKKKPQPHSHTFLRHPSSLHFLLFLSFSSHESKSRRLE